MESSIRTVQVSIGILDFHFFRRVDEVGLARPDLHDDVADHAGYQEHPQHRTQDSDRNVPFVLNDDRFLPDVHRLLPRDLLIVVYEFVCLHQGSVGEDLGLSDHRRIDVRAVAEDTLNFLKLK